MSNIGNPSGKIVLAKQRITRALTEYAINWDTLKDSLDKKDLIGFLKIWKEEFDALKDPAPETLFYQLANLLSNLEIQRDMLRSGKNWTKPADNAEAALPPELATIKTTIDAITV